jgi:DNA polymerase-3 subunit gamma/tau
MTSLYRRHRPQSFDEVVGQSHIVRTLRNAIEQDKVHHAYLFVGSRGTGKTSIAKILARSLNCVNGPTVTPCGECESCRTIANSTSLDVIEMDAASNNSVDDIRDLREKVGFAPAVGTWKVYILDEAHMLSTAAWNAFLKTLEEPPPKTIFVLATTEPHKVLATIVDRCHRFDFQRPSLDEITAVLRKIADSEQIEADDRTLAAIARSAAGSFRDAIGTLDQLVTYGGKQVVFEDVLEVLNVADAELIFKTTDALIGHDPRAALECVEELITTGRDPQQFMRDLTAHLRQLVVVQTIGSAPDSFSVTADQTERLEAQAQAISQLEAVRAIDLVAEALRMVKEGSEARIQLELALLKGARPRADTSTDALLARLERLEQASGTPDGAAPKEAPPPAAGKAPNRESTPRPPRRRITGATADIPLLDDLQEQWPKVLGNIREGEAGALLGALLEEAQPVGLEGGQLVIGFPADAPFKKRKAESKVTKMRIIESLQAVTGHDLSIRFEHSDELSPSGQGSLLSEENAIAAFKDAFDAEDVAVDSSRSESDEPPAQRGKTRDAATQPEQDDEAGSGDAGRDDEGAGAAQG